MACRRKNIPHIGRHVKIIREDRIGRELLDEQYISEVGVIKHIDKKISTSRAFCPYTVYVPSLDKEIYVARGEMELISD